MSYCNGVGSYGIGQVMGSVNSYQSSPLEGMVAYHSAVEVQERTPVVSYSSTPARDLYHRSASYLTVDAPSFAPDYAFAPDNFLKPGRTSQPFIGDAVQIQDEIREAFTATTGKVFPLDIRIAVLSDSEFKQHISDPHVVGFSLNRKTDGLVSDVFVRADEKDRVMLTIGHEIGHVLTLPVAGRQNEEAKAFAFSRAWMDAIKKEDIAGLGNSLVIDNPARNGLHDVACAFVWQHIKNGKDALALFWELVNGETGVSYGS